MIRRSLLVLAILLTGACAASYGPGAFPVPSGDPGPLVARLHGAATHLLVSVSDPAYVAIFEIVPGRGVGLVYPMGEHEQDRLVTGREWLPEHRLHRSRWFHDAGSSFYQPYAGPARFYLLIASRRPLYARHLVRSPERLRSVLGIHYASYSETVVIDRLVENIVPVQPDEDWTTDVLAIWPEPVYEDTYRQRLVRKICPDGSMVVVPIELVGMTCPRQRGAEPPPERPDTTDSEEPVTRPGGRRPVPVQPLRPETEETVRGETPEAQGGDRVRPAGGSAEGRRGFPAERPEPEPADRPEPSRPERQDRPEASRPERQDRPARTEQPGRSDPPRAPSVPSREAPRSAPEPRMERSSPEPSTRGSSESRPSVDPSR